MSTEREKWQAWVDGPRASNESVIRLNAADPDSIRKALSMASWHGWQAARTQPTPPASVEAALRELVEVEALKTRTEALHFIGPNGDLCDGWKAAYEAGRKEYIRRQPMAWDAARAALATPPAQPEPPFRPLMSDAAIEELINHSGGAWRDGEFRIDGKDLSTLLRGAFEAQPAPVVPADELRNKMAVLSSEARSTAKSTRYVIIVSATAIRRLEISRATVISIRLIAETI